MKFPQFRYARPETLAEAIHLLEAAEGSASAIAGGQSLLAGLSMRIAAPTMLVDIGELNELRGIALVDGGRSLRIGALTKHVDVQRSALIAEHAPLLHDAIEHVGHAAIRNRGTLGGSLAYADPSAELPACVVALDARLGIVGPSGPHEIPATSFFTGFLETALQPGELIADVVVPTRAAGERHAILEFARRGGDFALVGLAAVTRIDAGLLRQPRFVYFGCTDSPRPALRLGALLDGRTLPLLHSDNDALAAAVDADIMPSDSPGCRADTKRHLAQVITRRLLDRLHLGVPA